MSKIIILDYSTGEVFIFDYDENIYESYEDFYEDINSTGNYNFTSSQTNCMIVDNINIKVV